MSKHFIIKDNILVYQVEIPEVVANAVSAGRAVLTSTVCRGGSETWVQLMDPDKFHQVMDLVAAEDELLSRDKTKIMIPSPPSSPVQAKTLAERPVKVLYSDKRQLQTPERDDIWSKKMNVTESDLASNRERLLTAVNPGGFSLDLPSGYRELVPYDAAKDAPTGSWILGLNTRDRQDMWVPKIDRATEIVQKDGLMWHKLNGLKQQYPSDSLVPQDFSRASSLHFKARVVTVAYTIGAIKAWNRIQTDPGMKMPRASDLTSWWRLASPDQRFKLLVKESRVKYNAFKLGCQTRMNTIDCPFQGADLYNDSE